MSEGEEWDVFISHASEDKDDFVRPLAEGLRGHGLRVWYDEFTLKVGDRLRESIDRGLGQSRFGVVVLSQHFFSKKWPRNELDGLVTREGSGPDLILPVWHNVTREQVEEFSPILTGRFAARSEQGLERVIKDLTKVIGTSATESSPAARAPENPQQLGTTHAGRRGGAASSDRVDAENQLELVLKQMDSVVQAYAVEGEVWRVSRGAAGPQIMLQKPGDSGWADYRQPTEGSDASIRRLMDEMREYWKQKLQRENDAVSRLRSDLSQ